MKPFLIVCVALVPIGLTGIALGYISSEGRRYIHAELRLIDIIERRSGEDDGYYYRLLRAKEIAETISTDTNPALDQLAVVIRPVVEAAEELNQRDARTIARILRYGSDYNRARYLAKLLNAVEPPPWRRGQRDYPGPSLSPSPSSHRALGRG